MGNVLLCNTLFPSPYGSRAEGEGSPVAPASGSGLGVTEWYTKELERGDRMQLFNMTYDEAKQWQSKGWFPVWHSDTRCLMDLGVVKTCDECIEREYGKTETGKEEKLQKETRYVEH